MKDNELVKRLTWAGLLWGLELAAAAATARLATMIWTRIYGEEPPK
jgi:hypothetical protein